MATTHRVFVYGTLRRGQSNAAWLAGAPFLGPAMTTAAFTLHDTGPYPAAIDAGQTALVGEVYAIDDDTLAALDRLEGYPLWYTRRLMATPHGSAWIYLWAGTPDPHWPVIVSGDWAQRAAGAR